MSFSTNLTNPLSAYNMTSNNLTAGNLRNARFQEPYSSTDSSSSSESDDGIKVTDHKTSIKKKKFQNVNSKEVEHLQALNLNVDYY